MNYDFDENIEIMTYQVITKIMAFFVCNMTLKVISE